MELLIHPGMPKTGSSSIQKTLLSRPPDNWFVPARNSGNMGRDLILLFEDRPWEAPTFKIQGWSKEEIISQKEDRSEELKRQLSSAASAGLDTVFTAERLFNVTEEVIARLRDFYAEFGYSARVVGYVRKPVSFMQSAFQQNVKTDHPGLLEPKNLFPQYCRGFQKFDTVFGRENVKLKLFDPGSLIGADVVADFYHELGVGIAPEDTIRVNESLSLEACALLFAQRTLGRGFAKGFRGAGKANADFVDALSSIGSRRLEFSRSFVEPMIEQYNDDLRWIERRLGVDILDLPRDDEPGMIGSADDLIQEALSKTQDVECLIQELISKSFESEQQELLSKLELLRKMAL